MIYVKVDDEFKDNFVILDESWMCFPVFAISSL